jgi:photosystem II stability/assembly factor-like uncharacterized protein
MKQTAGVTKGKKARGASAPFIPRVMKRAYGLRLFRHASLSLAAGACCFYLFAHTAAAAWVRQQSNTMAWLRAVHFLDERKGWAAGGNGTILWTVDGGEHWSALARKPTEDAIRDIYFTDERTGWIVCERDIYKLKTREEPRTYLMKTADGGESWRLVNVIGADSDARLVRLIFTEGGRGWAFGEGGALYATRDKGMSWSRRLPPTRHLLLGGTFLDGDHGWLVGAGATILQTFDGGETWRAGLVDARGVRFTAVSFVEQRIGWAVGSGGRIYMTLDGGRTWNAQKSPVQADLMDVKFLSASEGWAVGSEGVLLHTTDSGIHWNVEESGTTHPLERIFFAGRSRAWVVGFGGTILSYTRAPGGLDPPVLKTQK